MQKSAAATTALALFLGSAALAIGAPATAAPERSQRGAAQSSERSAHQRIVDYWTPARRASATPRDAIGPESRANGGPPGKPDKGGGGGGGETTTVTGAPWPDKTAPVAKTTGKVFFTLGGSNYACSASAVAGPVNLVLTAGHCVWDDTAGFATNWLFWPGYDNGSKPYGEWTATSLFTTTAWNAPSHAWPDDTGMAVVTGGAGSPSLTSVLGPLPSMASASGQDLADKIYSAFGYPAAKKYKGGTLIYCQGPVQTGYDGNPDTMSMECDMTGGSSGGPWYSQPNGTGEIVSVNSYGYKGLARMFGPTFDAQEGTMYGEASDGTCDTGEVCAGVGATTP